ncbi:MAG: hypothetical protein ACXWE0_08690, partial [Nitrososphaeraceae archaeon]
EIKRQVLLIHSHKLDQIIFSAGILLLLKKIGAIELTISSGFALLIWIFTELYLLKNSHWLHTAMFVIGIVILVASMFLIKFSKIIHT